jgi:hypothetical protein
MIIEINTHEIDLLKTLKNIVRNSKNHFKTWNQPKIIIKILSLGMLF